MHLLKNLTVTCLIALASSTAVAQDRPQVIAVNFALQSFAERLLGDDVDVVFPAPADVDPSFWRPSIADISMIQSADLILLNGAGFATWVDRVSLPRSKVVNTTAAIEDQFIVTESITHSHGEGDEHSHEGLASYTWLDPSLATAQAEAIAAAIISRDLAPADDVEDRLNDLRTDLAGLDAKAQSEMIDLQNVTIIATHPRYQYLARHYDLTIKSLEWEAGATPDAAQLADLEALIADTGSDILIWEAAPPAAAFEATTSLGLRNIVFDPLARGIEGRTFIDAFADGLSALVE